MLVSFSELRLFAAMVSGLTCIHLLIEAVACVPESRLLFSSLNSVINTVISFSPKKLFFGRRLFFTQLVSLGIADMSFENKTLRVYLNVLIEDSVRSVFDLFKYISRQLSSVAVLRGGSGLISPACFSYVSSVRYCGSSPCLVDFIDLFCSSDIS